MDYKINLDTFRGPLDLLLYLVKRNEVDICDIPVATIARQFQEYLDVVQLLDVEWAGDFLVMAATLMEIKSKMLLPRNEEQLEEEEDDPRMQLVKQLIEYKKYKGAAAVLDERVQEHSMHVPRHPIEPKTTVAADQQPISKVELWDLVSAFGRLIREISALQPREIVMDETPMHVNMEYIEESLKSKQRATFAELFTPPHTRGRLIGLFLAVLELIKGHRIVAEQDETFGELIVRLNLQLVNGD